jgi:hypothetical protein
MVISMVNTIPKAKARDLVQKEVIVFAHIAKAQIT